MSKKDKRRFLKLPNKAKLVIAASSGVAVVVIALVSVMALLNKPQQTSVDEGSGPTKNQLAANQALVAQAKRDSAIHDSAQAAISNRDVAGAEKVYADEIASVKETTRKVQLYIAQSGLLYDNGDPKAAIAAAKAAEAISDDKFLIADWLSRIYEDQKQYALAAQYYTLAGQWATSPTNLTALDKAYYDQQAARVTELEKK